MLINFIKNLSDKTMRCIDWAVQGLLVLTIAMNGYILGKTGHLSALASAGTGFNVAALFYGAMLRRAYKRTENVWSMLFEQEKVIRRLYRLLENKKQPVGFANSPINPDRN